MATISENGLFPPLMEAYAPAQDIKNIIANGLIINYASSQYNDLSDIKSIHISVINQFTYNSLLDDDPGLCKNGIYVYDIPNDHPIDYSPQSFNILYTYLNNSQLAYNTYYKIQVRFCKIQYADYREESHPDTSLVGYLADEAVMAQCSEWSTVTLTKVIAHNQLALRQNNTDLQNEGILYTGWANSFQASNITITGTLNKIGFVSEWDSTITYQIGDLCTYKDQTHSEAMYQLYSTSGYHAGDECKPTNSNFWAGPMQLINANIDYEQNDNEAISTYRVQLYQGIVDGVVVTRGSSLLDSGNISSVKLSDGSQINYTLPFLFESYEDTSRNYYVIDISYVTDNLFTKTQTYLLRCDGSEAQWSHQNTIDEITALDSVIGKVNVSFMPTAPTQEIPQPVIPAGTVLSVRRSSKTSKFLIWELIWQKTVSADTEETICFDDYTIESGELYQYQVSCQIPGDDTIYSKKEGYILSVFDNAFLTGESTQLCVKFNTNISSFKYNVGDNIVTTIGSQYPYVTRNGNMNYRTFSLSGTIAYEMDGEHTFTSRSQIYDEWIDIYGSYFINRFINSYNDRITQREFREKVMDYFYDDKPKLFRSTPEGNILVRITDVSLSPNQQLGRMIYDFSCTVTEIGDASIENCKLYSIQDFGDLTS